jgi:hypothetical protein
MTEMFRDCPECGADHLFAQCHPDWGGCPDSADGCCPEWYCVDCGTVLVIGALPARPLEPARLHRRARVA